MTHGRSTGFEHDNADAEHDRHIGNIEDSSPKWTNPHVHEINDSSMSNPVQEVGNAAAHKQSASKKSPRCGPASPHSGDQKRKQDCVPCGEDRCSDRKWPVCTQAQERTRILGVLKTKCVGEE